MLVYKQVSFVWLSSRLSSPRTQRPTFAAWCWAASGEGYLALIQTDQGRRTGDRGSRAVRLGYRVMFLSNNLCLKYKEKGCLVSANAKRIFAIGGLTGSLTWA